MNGEPDILKARYGQPCNGCGKCCQDECCPLATIVFRQEAGPCPALEVSGGRFSCGLVDNPARYAPIKAAVVGADRLGRAAAFLIGAGHGCDAKLANEPSDPAFKAKLANLSATLREQAASALVAWGIRS